MSIIAAAALVAFSKVPCEWDAPGHDPYMGEVPAAIEHYTDIPSDVRARLRDKMERRAYDDLVIITRDEIVGDFDLYTPGITFMHFGSKGRICPIVTREKWSDDMAEFALVYCDGPTCIMVPTICRNVARVTRYGVPPKLPPVPLPPPRLENPPIEPLGPLPPPFETLPPPLPTTPGADYGPPRFYWPIYLPPLIILPPIILPPVVPPIVPPVVPPTTIPEPAMWLLFGAGLLFVALRKRNAHQ